MSSKRLRTLKSQAHSPPTGKGKAAKNTPRVKILSSVRQSLKLGLSLVLVASLAWWYRGTPSQTAPRFSTPFEVVDLPGRGKGAVATRSIRQGELVLQEAPLFVLPNQITTSPSTLVLSHVDALESSERATFYNLSYVQLPKDIGLAVYDEQLALAIFQTNAVSAGENVGVFPRMARLNHGCASAFNVVYSWREREGTVVVHALKDINKGQELLTTYTNTKRPRQERRGFLFEHYDFNCTCAVCTLPPMESLASDGRLSTMSRLFERLGTWSEGAIDGKEAIDVIRRIWVLGEEEGYWSERGSLAADAAWVAAAHADETSVREWADLAQQWYSIELGSDSDRSTEMKIVMLSPRKHPVWSSKEQMDVGGPLGMN